MKYLPRIVALFALLNLSYTLFAADVEITFDGAPGTTIGSTGTDTGSWSQNDLTLGEGTLNIGITELDQSLSLIHI